MREIILASSSPRRKELLRQIGLKFKADAGAFREEITRAPQDAEATAVGFSCRKAASVAANHPDAIIIAADTLVVFRQRLLGKPDSPAEARKMLSLLSGKGHRVVTGYTIIDTRSGRSLSGSQWTRVWMVKLTRGEIDAYVQSGEPLDKAGAYAIQGLGAALVKKIEGDYSNVVGLPLCSLAASLKEFGIDVLKP